MTFNLETIYNILLLALEKIATIIYSAFNRPFANILLQIYPGLIMIGNIGTIIKLFHLDSKILRKNILFNKGDSLIQIIYLLFLLVFISLILIFDIDKKTFDEKIIIFIYKRKK